MIVKADFKYTVRRLVNYLWGEVLFSILISSLVYYLYEHRELTFLSSFSVIPVSLLATILSVFLAFRNNNSYARWWEARQLWGELINASRYFKVQIRSIIMPSLEGDGSSLHDNQLTLLRHHVAYVNLLRMRLRASYRWNEVEPYLTADESLQLRQSHNPASELLTVQAQHLQKIAHAGGLTDFRLISMLGTIERFHNVQGACERIKNTPFPREYDGLIRVLIWILVVSLPFYLLGLFADDVLSKIFIIPLTVISTLVVGFANKAGEILEDPFENRVHDVPLTAMCQTIESDMLSGEPQTAVPVERIAQAETWVIW
jgi:ion channel-forming bestrophin family protein